MKAGVAGKRVLRKRKLTEGTGMIPDAGKGSRKGTSGEISDDMLEALAFAAAWRGKRRRPRKKNSGKIWRICGKPLIFAAGFTRKGKEAIYGKIT